MSSSIPNLKSLSCELESLPGTSSLTRLERRPPKDLSSALFIGNSSWIIEEVNVIDDDPASSVIMSQEKLRDHSVTRFGTGILIDYS
jgi:hypothetical protein